MKLIIVLAIIAFAGFILAEAEATYSDVNCRGVLGYTTFNADYQGSQFDIDIPDLFIDDANCENKAALAATWLNIEPTRNRDMQWIETGVTVGWIQNNDYGRSDPECITTESAYYAISAENDAGDRIYIEQNADPHGDNVGINKRFKIEKLNNHYLAYYGDSRTLQLTRDYGFGVRNMGLHVDYGIEGTISPILEYSSIPNVKFTGAQYKSGNTWSLISSFTKSDRIDTEDGYKAQLCSADGSMVAGAVTELHCSAVTVSNTAPVHTATTSYTTSGTPPYNIA